ARSSSVHVQPVALQPPFGHPHQPHQVPISQPHQQPMQPMQSMQMPTMPMGGHQYPGTAHEQNPMLVPGQSTSGTYPPQAAPQRTTTIIAILLFIIAILVVFAAVLVVRDRERSSDNRRAQPVPLHVTSAPSGARVLLDEIEQSGVTPVALQVAPNQE